MPRITGPSVRSSGAVLGYWSDRDLELSDRDRLVPQPGKFVSVGCFQDDALRALIKERACSQTCSYSGRRSRKHIAAPLDIVVQRIFEGLSSRYEDAANGVGWDEGEYVGANTWDTYDLLSDNLDIDDDRSDKLLADIVDALPQRIWSEIDPYGPRGHQILSWSWATFENTVKHERRYFFHQRPSKPDINDGEISPTELLEKVAAGCAEYGLIRVLAPGQSYFRCRVRPDRKTCFTLPQDLGPPPPRFASQSRMSPAGIPMFYGARSRATAKAETLGPADRRYAIAEFKTTRVINVLDLRKPPFISIFDVDKSHLYDWALFMRAFITAFRQPVTRDGSEHIDYVPTQVVTEYFRAAVLHNGLPLDGILYTSTKSDRQTCVVLFAEQADVGLNVQPHHTSNKGNLLALVQVSNKVRLKTV